ncbi:MAG TPA: methyl-accepting chemotaxis protein [Bacteroidota bacterium]|nr:methyl-accepting chemotaxis protein [Bacteroidota bacterium]
MNGKGIAAHIRLLAMAFTLLTSPGMLTQPAWARDDQLSAKEKLQKLLEDANAAAARHSKALSASGKEQKRQVPSAPTPAAVDASRTTTSPQIPVAPVAPPHGAAEETSPTDRHVSSFPLNAVLIGAGLVGLGALVTALSRKKLKAYRHWGLSAKVTFASVVAVIPLVLVVMLYVLPKVREQMYVDRIQATKQVVDVAYALMAEHQAMVDAGIMTIDEARQKTLERIRGLRYNKDDYFWINDLGPTMIMHPFKPELNGKDIGQTEDPNGKLMFAEMARLCKEQGEGPVDYMWPKPGVEKPVPKISYVKLFKPWGWIVGSGIYVEDVEAQLDALRAGILGGVLLAVLVACIVGIVVGRMIRKPVLEVSTQMANADLNTRFSSDLQNEIGELERTFDGFVQSIRKTLLEVKEASMAVASASAQISSSTEEMAAGAHEQTSQASEVASAVEEMSRTIHENSRNAVSTADTTKLARATAEQGGKVVAETVASIRRIENAVNLSSGIVKELGKSGDQIGEIIIVIDDIADQTNLLALNAAIEAARAGDQGRGFAVVADEVRKLAERTTKATKEIAEMIRKIQTDTAQAVGAMDDGTKRVSEGIALADRAGASLLEIVSTSQKVTDMVAQIRTASEEQSSASEQISKNVDAISSVTAQTASATQQIAKAADDLNKLTENLESIVDRFRLTREEGEGRPSARKHTRFGGANSRHEVPEKGHNGRPGADRVTRPTAA